MHFDQWTFCQRLADRLCHDFSGTVQGVSSAIDLMCEAKDEAERGEALAFLKQAAAAQTLALRLARLGFGSGDQASDAAEVRRLGEMMFAGIRPELVWHIAETRLPPAAGQAIIALLKAAADILAAGGEAQIAFDREDGRWRVTLKAVGPRAVLREDFLAGLLERPSDGLPGRRFQGAWIGALAQAAGGQVATEAREGVISLHLTGSD
jgi:hypothetical protein